MIVKAFARPLNLVTFIIVLISLCASGPLRGAPKTPQRGAPAGPPLSPKQSAVIELTGYWVSIVDEDWRWRMMTPPKGDFSSIPLNAEGRRVASSWDPAKDEADGNLCKAYGAAGLMRLPERLNVTWADDNTLEIDTDAGTQKRFLHFDGSKWQGGDPQLQGDSVASWQKQAQSRGFAPPFGGPRPGQGGSLKVVTSHMKPGYLRKNGVPYSGNAVLIEYFDRVEDEGTSYLILTSVVQDPQYLNGQFITSEQYKLEPNGSKWHPEPCKVAPPTSTALPVNPFG